MSRVADIIAWTRWPAYALLGLFIVSELLTDRVHAMQWAWWIPRPFLSGSALAWLVVVELVELKFGAMKLGVMKLGAHAGRGERGSPRRVLRGNRWAVAVAAVCAAYALHGMWRPTAPRPVEGVRLVHWNASFIDREADTPTLIGLLLALDADIVIVTDPGILWAGDGAVRFAAKGYELQSAGRFGVASRIPVAEARPILAQGRNHASRIEVDTRLGRLSIEAIDLPSDPWRSRWQTVTTVAGALAAQRAAGASGESGEAPDVIVGDFNITRGSASLRGFGAGYDEAFAAAGSGWGGTYHRERPWWAIDLALVGGRWKPARSEIVDPGVERHRLQVVDLSRR